MKEMEQKAGEVAQFLTGLASSHRLLILCQLAEGEKSVSELIETTGIAQSSMSQHLAKLKAEKIVDFRREHRVLFYFITNDVARDIMSILYEAFCNESEE